MKHPLQIRDMLFEWGTRTYIMGIVNVTPDSFSKDGLLKGDDWVHAATENALRMISEGADIIDIGGESTRPGNTPLAAEDELARVIPVISALRSRTNAVISIDTYKASVACAAIDAGADIVNDVWGLLHDTDIAHVIAEKKVPVIIMHNRPSTAESDPALGGRFQATTYTDIIKDIESELRTSIAAAHAAGIPNEHIILDPGIGFGKSTEQNLELVRRFAEFTQDYPTLVGPSRKSFVGYTLNLPSDERLEGTAAAVTLLLERGADIIRVHDVKEMRRVAAFCDATFKKNREIKT
jgi:dihydropteroate synthase